MPDAVVAAALQDIHEPDQVAVHVGMWVLQRVTDAGLGRQMDHHLRLGVRKQLLDGRAVRQIRFDKAEARPPCEQRQAIVLEPHVVVVVQVIQPDDLVALIEQPPADVKADEPRGSGHQ